MKSSKIHINYFLENHLLNKSSVPVVLLIFSVNKFCFPVHLMDLGKSLNILNPEVAFHFAQTNISCIYMCRLYLSKCHFVTRENYLFSQMCIMDRAYFSQPSDIS